MFAFGRSPLKPKTPASPNSAPTDLVPVADHEQDSSQSKAEPAVVAAARKQALPPPAPKLGRTGSQRSNSKRDLLEISQLGTPVAESATKISKTWRRDVSKDFSVSEQLPANRVREVLNDRTARTLLLNRALPAYVNKIKFCTAVDDYDKIEPKTEKKSKARKIVSLYVDPGAIFLLTDLPEKTAKALVAGKYEQLDDLRQVYVDEMAREDSPMRSIVDELFEEL